MTSLADLDGMSITMLEGIEGPKSRLNVKTDVPLQYKPEDLEYSNVIKNLQTGSVDEPVSEPETIEEKLAVKSEEIIDIFRTLRAKAAVLNKEISEHQVRIDLLNEKLEGINKAASALSTAAANTELSDMLSGFQTKAQMMVAEEIKTIQGKLNALFVDIAKVNESLSKINLLVFTGITETLKPEERERIANGKQCPICIAKPINRALDCGHVLCDGCVAKIGATCHMCRRRYTKVIKLFLDDTTGGAESSDTSITEVSGYVPNPTVAVAPWGSAIGAGQLIGVNTVGASLQSWLS